MRPLSRPPVLDPVELTELTRFFADEVARKRYPFVAFDAEHRWHQRIYRDPRIDIWLLSWLPEQGTELHDHGGSAGAFTVIHGVLSEAVFHREGSGTGRLVENRRPTGESVGFGSGYVHDVRNLSPEPAVSVHAYSRPLTTMNFYDAGGGRLRRTRTLATDHPEPRAPLGSTIDRVAS
jgi:cysteine dioxygenase type I